MKRFTIGTMRASLAGAAFTVLLASYAGAAQSPTKDQEEAASRLAVLVEHEPWNVGARRRPAEVLFRLGLRCVDAGEVLPGDPL